jgi:peptide chain release factor
MILLQITSAQGPAECCLAVALALRQLLSEANDYGNELSVSILEDQPGPVQGTLRSALLGLDGARAEEFAAAWRGTLQWICPSPLRPTHKRKNWFIGVTIFELPEDNADGDIRYETCRAGGPGGQHVNKTESAVRATHIATGISVRVQSERSQHANRRLASMLIRHKLNQAREQAQASLDLQRHKARKQVERGSARRVFRGMDFTPV